MLRLRSVAVLCCAVLCCGVLLAGCTGAPPVDRVRIGAGSTTEQALLAELTLQVLTARGIDATLLGDLGDSLDVRNAALDGDVDVIWDYSGAAWALGLGQPAPPVDPQQSFEAVAAADGENGLTWIGPSGIDARLTFFTQPATLAEGEDPSLSWLAGRLGTAEDAADRPGLCADPDYLSADSGLEYLVDTYAIAADVPTTSATEEAALTETADGACLAGLGTATSGRARELGLTPLADDRGVFPAQALAPVVVTDSFADAPQVLDVMEELSSALTTEAVAELNGRAAIGGAVVDVATAVGVEVGVLPSEER